MRAINHIFGASVLAAVLCLTFSEARAQNEQGGGTPPPGGRRRQGNFDPAQFRQRMMDGYRERLEVKDDAEWKVMQPLIQNVLDARMALSAGPRGSFGRRGRRRGENASPTTPTPPRDPARENPAADELRKAIEAKAPPPEMKAALAKYLEHRKAKQADLDRARDALRAVLTSRQEAIATLSGLL